MFEFLEPVWFVLGLLWFPFGVIFEILGWIFAIPFIGGFLEMIFYGGLLVAMYYFQSTRWILVGAWELVLRIYRNPWVREAVTWLRHNVGPYVLKLWRAVLLPAAVTVAQWIMLIWKKDGTAEVKVVYRDRPAEIKEVVVYRSPMWARVRFLGSIVKFVSDLGWLGMRLIGPAGNAAILFMLFGFVDGFL